MKLITMPAKVLFAAGMLVAISALAPAAHAFVPVRSVPSVRAMATAASTLRLAGGDDCSEMEGESPSPTSVRREFLSNSAAALSTAAAVALSALPVLADDGEETESVATRAARLSRTMEADELKAAQEKEARSPTTVTGMPSDTRTVYDFDLPVAGVKTPIRDIVRGTGKAADEADGPRAILFVNIKQDDVLARKNIPELIALASKFGRDGAFSIVCSPTDQGYYEPDTSQLIRLKLADEYGYGINPSTALSDKVQLLGTGSHPFWRYLQGTGRAPDGLGRIRGNFEKFLVDGRTGRAVRRYPRKYDPDDIADDIRALVEGRPLPPAGSQWREKWRAAVIEAESDTYRFQKGLNVFDQ